MTTTKNIFSFDINEAKTWQNPFDDNGELLITKKVQSDGKDYPFGTAQMMSIKEIKKILENDFSYKRPLDITGAVRRMKAFRPDFMKPILISKVKGEDKLTAVNDGNHSANAACALFADDVKVPVVVYEHNSQSAAEAFASWNREGIKPLSNDAVFPAQLGYGHTGAVTTLNVLSSSKHTFKNMPNAGKTQLIAGSKRVTSRGNLDKAIKISPKLTTEVLALVETAYPTPKEGLEVSSMLVYALVKGLTKVSTLRKKPQPQEDFVAYFVNEARNGKSQFDYLSKENRVHNKEAESIFGLLLHDFIFSNNDKDYAEELTDTFFEHYADYVKAVKVTPNTKKKVA